MLKPGTAAIVNTQPTGGHITSLHIAVIDAATGHPLLDAFAYADDHSALSTDSAARDTDPAHLTPATNWPMIVKQLRHATQGRYLLAHDADVDYHRILSAATHCKVSTQQLGEPHRWQSVTRARSRWLDTPYCFPLQNPGQALGGCHRVRGLVNGMAAGPPDAMSVAGFDVAANPH